MTPRTVRSWGFLVLTCLALGGRAATLADFGYQHMRINGKLAAGARPIVIILIDYGSGAFAHPQQYYWEQVFNPFVGTRDMNGFFLENSNGRFRFSPETSTIIGPLRLTANEQQQAMTNDVMKGGHCLAAAVRAGLDFSVFDANRDGVVSQDELTILIVENAGTADGGAARWANPQGNGGQSFQPPGSSVAFNTMVCLVTQSVSFATLCHEVSHLLGTIDLYGSWSEECLSQFITLMSCTITSPDNPDIYHMDPWHKLQLGWDEPRLFPISANGAATLPAAQAMDPTAPVILYEPGRGLSEFFILEYRTAFSPSLPNYDRDVGDSGLALWHVQQDGNHNAALVLRVEAGTLPAQKLWRFCTQCRGLHYITDLNAPRYGPCPAGGVHNPTNSSAYMVVLDNASAPGQHQWRYCQKCAGMFYGPGQLNSHCAGGGIHDGTTSGDYSFVPNDPYPTGQTRWRWCGKCQVMFFGPDQAKSVCPAGGQHDGSQSSDYAILRDGLNAAVWNEAPPITPPAYGRGSSRVWHAGDALPPLRWNDGSLAQLRVLVGPFRAGDGSISVEWRTETWVDFGYLGFPPLPEIGSFVYPFNTLGEGLSAASAGGFLTFKSGATPETAFISKPMTLRAYGGPAKLGGF